jgi:hypothetical protein
MGIVWLESKGYISIEQRDESTFWLVPGTNVESPDLAEITNELNSMLAETAAFRAYFRSTSKRLT